jgi:antitoxin component of MazEF toxin-antitoxin module
MSTTRKLVKVSTNSYAIIVPKTVVKKYGWKEHQKLTIKDAGKGKLEIRDWKRR